MFMRVNNFNKTTTDTTQVEIKEELTRKEKKAKYGFSWYRPEKKQFYIPDSDKKVLRRRKSKKYSKTLLKQHRNIKEFYKSESIFNDWLSKNIDRFNIKPMPKAGGGFHFEGVTKEVSLELAFFQPEAMLHYHYYGKDNVHGSDTFFDERPIEYIGDEAYNPQKGFYDRDRTDEIYTYFPSRKELYINEVFETIITYTNKVLIPENSLYINDAHGTTSAKIDSTDESSERFNLTFIDNLTDEECYKLRLEDKAWRVIKYDLFDLEAAPLIRYIMNESSDD